MLRSLEIMGDACAAIEGETRTMATLLIGNPEHTAFICRDVKASRRELRIASLRGAALLNSLGVKRGDAVCAWLPDGGAWLQLLFACAHMGVLLVPISTRLRHEEARHVVETSKAKVIFVPREFLRFDYHGTAIAIHAELDHVSHVIEVVDPNGFIPVDGAFPNVPETGTPEDGLCIFSTSGTTGRPKLAVHTQSGIVQHARNVAKQMGMDSRSVMLCGLSLYGVMGFVQAVSALAAEAQCVLMQVFDGERAALAIREHKVTHLFGSDSMCAPIWEALGPEPTTLQSCGLAEFAGMSATVIEHAERVWGLRGFGIYGASECFALAFTQCQDEDAASRSLSGGKPISSAIEFRVVDLDSGFVVADGGRGELQLRGYNVLKCYLHNSQATADAFTTDGWFRTGDLVERRADRIIYLSRLKDGLRLRGYLVDPVEIESHLCAHALVEEAQVVGVQRPGVGDVAVAFVRLSNGQRVEDELLLHCRNGMANYKVPQRIVIVDDFPRIEGPNGTKILKNKLREIAEAAIPFLDGVEA